MGTTIKHTDLSDEDPGPRAIVDSITLGGQLSLTGGKMTLRARLVPGSPFYRLVAAIALHRPGASARAFSS